MRTFLAIALLLSGCAAAPADAPLTAADYMGVDDVETAARLLAIAAESEGTVRHAQAVVALGRLGARAAADEPDLVAQWAAALPADDGPPLRGRLLGPAYRSGTLPPGTALATAQVFEGGKPARISLTGQGGAPLAMTVSNGGPRPVCATSPGTSRNCRWTPPFSGRYEIRVENAAREPARYFLVIG